jgi:hypothetical protein
MKRLAKSFVLASAALLLSGTAYSQSPAAPAHFDMTPEADLREVLAPPPADATTADAVAAPAAPKPDLVRYLLPEASVRLAGENDRRDYHIYLTAAQAAASATLQLGYINALVAAPETSRLRVEINGTTVANTPVGSSSSVATVSAQVPQGVLQPGFNLVTIRADQRHRTDCSVESTYELWSDISGADTFLAFSGQRVGLLSRLDDMAAAGWGADGQSSLRLVMPERTAIENGLVAAQVVQDLALNIRNDHLRVTFGNQLPLTAEAGALTVFVGTASAMPEQFASLAAEARNGPVAAFATDAANTLVLSGPNWAGVEKAMESVRTIAAQYPPVGNAIPPRAAHALPVPILESETTTSFSSMGVAGTSFNGRRYRTSFDFGLPADFYANKYGQAEINLRAAYSGEVLPGSQIDVYVNGQIASVTPILRTNDALRDLSIKVPMTGLKSSHPC